VTPAALLLLLKGWRWPGFLLLLPLLLLEGRHWAVLLWLLLLLLLVSAWMLLEASSQRIQQGQGYALH
jgi:hypothetical protein